MVHLVAWSWEHGAGSRKQDTGSRIWTPCSPLPAPRPRSGRGGIRTIAIFRLWHEFLHEVAAFSDAMRFQSMYEWRQTVGGGKAKSKNTYRRTTWHFVFIGHEDSSPSRQRG